MIRIYKGGDIKFDMTKVSGVAEKYYCHFYTKNVENYIKKTSDEATEEGVIPLNWTDLQLLEQGVMYIAVYNLTDDQDFDDGVYNNTFVRTTQYYIVTNNTDLDVINKEISELTKNLNNEIQDRENADTILQENIDAKANAADVYTKAEVDEKIKDVDLSNYYTKTESDAKYSTQEVVNEEIAARIKGDNEINATLLTKADKTDLDNYYTKTETDEKLTEVENKIPDVSIYETTEHAEATYATKTELSNEVTKLNQTISDGEDALQSAIDTKANSADVYSKTEIDAKLEDIPTDGYKHKQITEADYEALTDKGENTIYIISDKTDDTKITHQALTTEEYAALASKDAETLYIIKN